MIFAHSFSQLITTSLGKFRPHWIQSVIPKAIQRRVIRKVDMSQNTVFFGQWLRQRRRSLDLTQTELARLVGCSTVNIRKLESHERRPSRQMASLLADQLGIA